MGWLVAASCSSLIAYAALNSNVGWFGTVPFVALAAVSLYRLSDAVFLLLIARRER